MDVMAEIESMAAAWIGDGIACDSILCEEGNVTWIVTPRGTSECYPCPDPAKWRATYVDAAMIDGAGFANRWKCDECFAAAIRAFGSTCVTGTRI